jgi:RNA polymerase sigma-70 factor, ECF subfamily
MANESDRLLVQQIRAGDQEAWRQLILCYQGRLWAYVHRRIRNAAVCDDLVQETLLGFYTSLDRYDETRSLQTFLFAIASYKLADHLRAVGRHPMQQLADPEPGIDAWQQRPDNRPAASSVARGKERVELEEDAVARCLGGLIQNWFAAGDFRRVQALEMIYVKGWANKDVAKLLGYTEQQIANIRFAATKKLGDAIRDAGLPTDVFPELAASLSGEAEAS